MKHKNTFVISTFLLLILAVTLSFISRNNYSLYYGKDGGMLFLIMSFLPLTIVYLSVIYQKVSFKILFLGVVLAILGVFISAMNLSILDSLVSLPNFNIQFPILWATVVSLITLGFKLWRK